MIGSFWRDWRCSRNFTSGSSSDLAVDHAKRWQLFLAEPFRRHGADLSPLLAKLAEIDRAELTDDRLEPDARGPQRRAISSRTSSASSRAAS